MISQLHASAIIVDRSDTTPRSPAPELAVTVRRLGHVEYEATWHAMQAFTAARTATTPDEFWLLEHPPVYTLGIAGKSEHLPRTDNGVPVIHIDRGGQITYHGPGQVILYLLLDMRRRDLSVRTLVRRMEQAVIDLVGQYGIVARGDVDAPGVYVAGAKIAALGLRIRRGCCYHGLALNVDMDLSPFRDINPCGYPGLEVTQLRELGVQASVAQIGDALVDHLLRVLA